MANITASIKVQHPCKIEAPVYDHKSHGWYAPNSIVVGDCVPTYRNSGGSRRNEYNQSSIASTAGIGMVAGSVPPAISV